MSAHTEESAALSFKEYTRATETLIAQCMAEQGFDYIPSTEGITQVAASEPGTEITDPIANARQNGYGIGSISYEVEDLPDNPNQAIREAMNSTELAAHELALYGPYFDALDADATTFEDGESWEDAGCAGKAAHEVEQAETQTDPMAAVLSDPQWAELLAEMNGLTIKAHADPRMVDLNGSWSVCMTAAGFDFESPEAAVASFMDLTAVPDTTSAAESKQHQIDVAVADFTCQAEIDLENERLRVQFAIEQEFVDANAADLKAFSAALETAGQ